MSSKNTTHLIDGRVTVDIVSRLLIFDGEVPKREQHVLKFIRANLEQVSTMTIAELAAACDVSPPTVVRFCRTLGCDGFREFKLRLAQNLAVSLQYLDAPTLSSDMSDHGILDQILRALSATLNIMRQQLDSDSFAAAKSAISAASNVVIGGLGGGSSMLAYEAANRLFRLGIMTIAVSDSYTLQMRAATLSKNDVLLLISASGEAKELLKAAEIGNGYEATTLAITKGNSALAKLVHTAIELELPEDPDIYKPTSSRYAFMVIIDALAMAVAQSQSEKTTENLRRIRASLTAYHGRTGPQPLGD